MREVIMRLLRGVPALSFALSFLLFFHVFLITPVQADEASLIPRSGFEIISAGTYHTCGLKTDSTITCWGSNSYGQSTPPAGTFTQVSAGMVGHTCGVKTDSTIDCWGDDRKGQSTYPAGVRFTQVSAGYEHTCGLKTDGHVDCWGDNTYGQSEDHADTFTQVRAGS